MPVRVISRNPIPQPQNIRDAQIFPKHRLVIFPRKSWIPLLRLAQQTLFRSQQRPFPIYVNRSALQHHPPSLKLRQNHAPLQSPVRLRHHRRIFLMVRVFRPSIKHEIVVRHFARRVLHANRPRIPHPPAICSHPKKRHRLQRSPRLLQNPAHPRFRLAILHQQKHPFHPRQLPHNFRERPRYRRKFPRPIRQLMWPPQPRSLMLLPLRRHPPSHPHLSHPLLRPAPTPSFRAERGIPLPLPLRCSQGDSSLTLFHSFTLSLLPFFSSLCELCVSALSFLFLLRLLQPSLQNPPKRIHPPIPEKRPIPPRLLALLRIASHHHFLFLALGGLCFYPPKRPRHKRISPKLQPRIALLRFPLKPHAIHRRHINPVRHRMCPLNRPPRIQLRRAKLRLLVRMPSNARRIKNHLCSAHRRNPRTLRIPLVPADLHANPRILRIKIQKSQIPRRKIKLFVVQRIIRYMHLPVFPQVSPIRIQNRACVVVHPRRAPLKQRRHQRHLLLLRHLRQSLRSRPRHRFRQIKKLRLLRPAKIFPCEQFVQANNLCSPSRRFANLPLRPRQILFPIFGAPHLHQPHRKFIRHIHRSSPTTLSLLLFLCELCVSALSFSFCSL